MDTGSFWAHEPLGEYAPLRGFHQTDAVVIGGGFTGITTALWLCRAGLRVVLLEGETLACGASSRCAGMLSVTDRFMLKRLEQQRGSAVAEAYIRSRKAAFGAIRSLARETEELEWQDADACLLADGKGFDLSAEAELLRRGGTAADEVQGGSAPLPARQILAVRDMAHIHPMKYFACLTRMALRHGLTIHEHSRVVAVETNLAQTPEGAVKAPFLIVATGYPIINVPGWYFLRLSQRRRYLAAAQGSVGENMFYDGRGRFALRGIHGGILAQMDGGMVGERRENSGHRRWQQWLGRYLGEPSFRHEGIETFSADGLPYIGVYSSKTPNLFVATGYGGKGLLGSMTAAQLISARVLGLAVDSDFVFSGQRRGYAVTAAEAATTLAMAGRYAGGVLHPFAPHCPHMGCKLVYSRERRVWECPCHGSRFDGIGHLLSAPATEPAIIRRRH